MCLSSSTKGRQFFFLVVHSMHTYVGRVTYQSFLKVVTAGNWHQKYNLDYI